MARRETLLAGALLLCSTLWLSTVAVSAERVISGAVCSKQVDKLTTEIDWHKWLNKALDAAKNEDKLVFWVHMVGKIDGAT